MAAVAFVQTWPVRVYPAGHVAVCGLAPELVETDVQDTFLNVMPLPCDKPDAKEGDAKTNSRSMNIFFIMSSLFHRVQNFLKICCQ